MNKKLVYIFVVLVAGIFLISACQQDAVGARRINNRNIVDQEGAAQGAVVPNNLNQTNKTVPIIRTVELTLRVNPPEQGEIGYGIVTAYLLPDHSFLFSVNGKSGDLNYETERVRYDSYVQISGGVYYRDSNWTFSNWTGDASGNSSRIEIRMDRDKTIIGNFRRV